MLQNQTLMCAQNGDKLCTGVTGKYRDSKQLRRKQTCLKSQCGMRRHRWRRVRLQVMRY